jgi:hypothetical protein
MTWSTQTYTHSHTHTRTHTHTHTHTPGCLAGSVHSRCGVAQARGPEPLLPPLTQP